MAAVGDSEGAEGGTVESGRVTFNMPLGTGGAPAGGFTGIGRGGAAAESLPLATMGLAGRVMRIVSFMRTVSFLGPGLGAEKPWGGPGGTGSAMDIIQAKNRTSVNAF